MKKTAVAVLAALFSAAAAYAGEYAGESMSIGAGARALGMGGAFTAVADDASSYYWNPAGIALIQGVEVSSIKLIAAGGLDSDYTHLNAVYNPGEGIGAFGASYLKQSFGGIKIINSSGMQAAGEKETADNVVTITYSRRIAGWISAGVNFKALFGAYPLSEGSVSYTGFGFDAAVLADAGNVLDALKGLKIGINLQDPRTSINWAAREGLKGGEEIMSPNLKTGISYDLQFGFLKAVDTGVVVSGDLDTKYGGEYHFGAECVWNGSIAVRGGLKGYLNSAEAPAQDATLSFGAGIKWNFLGIDYAYVSSDIEPLQYISISGRF